MSDSTINRLWASSNAISLLLNSNGDVELNRICPIPAALEAPCHSLLARLKEIDINRGAEHQSQIANYETQCSDAEMQYLLRDYEENWHEYDFRPAEAWCDQYWGTPCDAEEGSAKLHDDRGRHLVTFRTLRRPPLQALISLCAITREPMRLCYLQEQEDWQREHWVDLAPCVVGDSIQIVITEDMPQVRLVTPVLRELGPTSIDPNARAASQINAAPF